MVEIDEMVPSADLVRALVGVDRAALDVDERLAAIAAWERVLSWATAEQHDLLVDADRACTVELHDLNAAPKARWYAERVGMALGISGGSAQRRMNQAVTMVEKLPNVISALRIGAITVHHARIAAGNVNVLDTQVAQAVDAAVMTDQDWRTPSQLEKAFRQTILELDPAGAAQRSAAARKGRRVSVRNEPDGMCSLWASLPAEQGQAVHKKIDAHARSSAACNTPDDHRTLEHRRADALVDLILRDAADLAADSVDSGTSSTDTGDIGDALGTGAGTASGTGADIRALTGGEPTLHGRAPQIHVTVSWSTLIGLDDAPADLTGYGPIDATTARRIAADPNSIWRRLLVDPASGRLLDYGRDTYRPPQDLTDFVIARDVFCRFPTCDRPALICDLDHRLDWEHGGCTCETNIDPLCRGHHRLKHEAGWTHHRDPDTGDSIWTDPAGGIHVKPATRLPTPKPVEPPDDDDLGDPPF